MENLWLWPFFSIKLLYLKCVESGPLTCALSLDAADKYGCAHKEFCITLITFKRGNVSLSPMTRSVWSPHRLVKAQRCTSVAGLGYVDIT